MKKGVLMLFLILGCNITSTSPKKIEELNQTYAQSLSFPNKNFDIIVFKTYIYECGNMTEEELNSYYNPDLLEEPFASQIKSFTDKKIIRESEIKDYKDLKGSKVLYIAIEGKVENSKEVVVNENYEFNDGSKSEYFIINKHLILKNRTWKCIVEKK
ncbi:hypothetical protein ACYE2N_06365 [Flavobacterium sp. MAHUQ-51]|uniref:hypothetical protein n=1 Tax=Flavobacterium sp. GCM10022190 TaxID=3252639 RepID=UPI00360DBA15